MITVRSDLPSRLRRHVIYERKRDNVYEGSYELIRAHFSSCLFDAVGRSASDVGVLLIYTWMGGVQPKLGALDNYSSCYDDLADAKRGLTLNAAQIDRVKEYVSGSLIGASKFLHFANPEIYPIWDRRVAEAMYGLPHYYQHQKTENYIQYIDDLSNIDVPDALLKSLRTKLGAASKVRLLEFSLFNLHVSEERQAATVGA